MPTLHVPRLARTLGRSSAVVALTLLALLPGLAYAAKPTPPTVPTEIQVPAGNVPFLLGHATGTQNYVCQSTSTGYAWTFVAPAATLVDDKGKQIATHYAGPTWEAKDGSTVVATLDKSHSVSGTIAWLLLKTRSTTSVKDGDRLTATTYIHRVNTTGGLAPTSGCDAAHVGDERKVDYTADYYFYRAGKSD